MPAPAVLHVTSIPGGGVDRHIRDIARASDREHIVWHAADGGDAIEFPAEKRVLALDRKKLAEDPGTLAAFLKSRNVGLVHVHALTEAPRARAAWVADSLGLHKIVTLHDVLFLRREAFEHGGPPAADEAWLRETSSFIRSASAVIAPSEYLASIARANLPGVPLDVIPNGSGLEFSAREVPVHREYRSRFRHVAIVLGAVGPHKGSRMLEQTAERLEGTDIGIVVIGYLDAANLPSWHRPHLFVHGSYQDTEVAALVRAYGARLGLFVNRVPESFSYALSDVWAAGLPVIVPSEGALGERVRAHGGGWILPPEFTANDVASMLERLFSPAGSPELARVESVLDGNDTARIPRLDAMSRSLDALYRRFGIEPASPLDAASPEAQKLLATSLDGSLFRAEMVRFADEIEQLRRGLDHERAASASSKAWMDKLQADVTLLQSQLAAEVQARTAAEGALFELRNEAERLRQAMDLLRAQYENIPRVLRRVFRRKPADGRG